MGSIDHQKFRVYYCYTHMIFPNGFLMFPGFAAEATPQQFQSTLRGWMVHIARAGSAPHRRSWAKRMLQIRGAGATNLEYSGGNVYDILIFILIYIYIYLFHIYVYIYIYIMTYYI